MLISEDQRLAILAPIDDSVGIDGRAEDGEALDLLRNLRGDRKDLVKLEQSAAMGGEPTVLEGGRDWEDLAGVACDYLARIGKDLDPMAVLIEASARSDDPADLAEAMTLLARLVETFWEQGLYPPEDDDEGVEARFQPLSGLSGGSQDRDGALIQPIRRMRLAASGGDALRYLDKVRADAAMTASQTLSGDAKEAKIAEAQELYGAIESLSRRIPPSDIERAWNAMTVAEQGWRDAIGFISERTKPRFPAASRLNDEFAGLRAWLGTLRTETAPEADGDAAEEAEAAAAEGGAGADASAAAPGFVAGQISRREDALKAIAAAAKYFQVNEPLSPLGATLREVDRRARLSLDELLNELIPSDSARNDFYWRSGIRPPTGSSKSGRDDDDDD